MSLFFLTFFGIYGSVHAYFFHKARSAFNLGVAASTLLALVLLFLTLAPFTVRVLERHGLEVLARMVAYPGYIWMGFLFLFFCIGLLCDIAGAGAWAYGFFAREEVHLLSRSAGFFLPCIVASVVSFYGYFEALHISKEAITIPTSKLPDGVARVRVVQLSDVHLGLLVKEKRLMRMLEVVRQADPDVLVVTGDLLDGQPDGYAPLASLFKEITPTSGKFVVTGNHDFYVGVERLDGFAREAGFVLLRNRGVNVPGVGNVVGVDDPAGRGPGAVAASEKEILTGLPQGAFTLLLKHRPSIDPSAKGLFDLQLSGHVHKGQIFPFNALTHLFYPVKMGLSDVGSGSRLYVSRGTGTWGPPVRFLAPPEVTIIDLVKG